MNKTPNYKWPVVPQVLEDDTSFEDWFRAMFGDDENAFITALDRILKELDKRGNTPITWGMLKNGFNILPVE